MLQENGYKLIGMDHFAKESDSIFKAAENKRLYRNFMGYTTIPTSDYLGLGLTSISFIDNHYFQNTKVLDEYYANTNSQNFSYIKSKNSPWMIKLDFFLIQSLMCNYEIDFNQINQVFNIDFTAYFRQSLLNLDPMAKDGLIKLSPNKIVSYTIRKTVFKKYRNAI